LDLRPHVCHFPPGTSKWNRIEHRLFSFITHNWRGRPLVSHQAVVNLIAHCRWPLHTSLLEGMNNRIKVLKRMAYGVRDDTYFFLKIRQAFPGNAG